MPHQLAHWLLKARALLSRSKAHGRRRRQTRPPLFSFAADATASTRDFAATARTTQKRDPLQEKALRPKANMLTYTTAVIVAAAGTIKGLSFPSPFLFFFLFSS